MDGFKNAAMLAMVKTLIGSLGIDAEALLQNLHQFQAYVVGAVKHHDSRLVALESELKSANRKLDILLSQLGVEQNGRTNELATGTGEHAAEHPAIEHAAG